MDTPQRPPERAGRPAGHERHAWTPVGDSARDGRTDHVDLDADPGLGEPAADDCGDARTTAVPGAEHVPASGRDPVAQPDIERTAGIAESIDAGDEGT